MNRLLRILWLFMMIPLLTGCIAFYENRITVNADHSVDVVLRFTIDKTDLDAFAKKSGSDVNLGQLHRRMADFKSQYQNLGFETQIIDAPAEYGLILSRHVGAGQAFAASDAGIGPLGFFKQEAFHLSITDTAIHFKLKSDLAQFRPVGDEYYQGSPTWWNYSSLHKDSKGRFVLDLPYPVQAHNASFVSADARHLEWDLVPGQVNEWYADAGRGAEIPAVKPPAPDIPAAQPPAAAAPVAPAKSDDGNGQPSAIDTITEQWHDMITDRDSAGRLVAFDLAEKNAFNYFGISDWRFGEYDRPVDRVKKVGYVVFVKWRLLVAEGFAELGSLLGE